jgi:adenylylsulfate kinase
MVIWLTGLSASGKTTIGKLVFKLLKEREQNTIFVDGDEIRKVFKWNKNEQHFSEEGRRKVAESISDLCLWLDQQGMNVICCTISLYDHLHRRNRKSFSGYFEVFLDTPFQQLRERDRKKLYSTEMPHVAKNVVGVDLPYNKPKNPDLVIKNKNGEDLEKIAQIILNKAGF